MTGTSFRNSPIGSYQVSETRGLGAIISYVAHNTIVGQVSYAQNTPIRVVSFKVLKDSGLNVFITNFLSLVCLVPASTNKVTSAYITYIKKGSFNYMVS